MTRADHPVTRLSYASYRGRNMLELRWAAGDGNIMLIERNRYCSGWHEQFVTLTPAQLRYAALMVGLEEDGRRDAPMLAQEEAERRAEGGDR